MATDIFGLACKVAKTFAEWDQTPDMMPSGEMLNALHELKAAVDEYHAASEIVQPAQPAAARHLEQLEAKHRAIAAALNCYSAENRSNTPDFILADMVLACLAAFDAGVNRREEWYGRTREATGGLGPAPVAP